MTALNALSKMGHRWMPKGLSMLGNGRDCRISVEVFDDMMGFELRRFGE
tara:strand:+ start:759 stop:905 length:147 start_codon:yes stop_codon:yes gene_type:complete